MPREFSRSERVGEVIQRELAQLIHFEIKDPRVQGVTITAVKVSRDMEHARIFFSILGENTPDTVLEGLEKAKGFLRHQLGKSLQMRMTPHLRFYHDDSVERGAHISAVIDAAIAEDREKGQS